MIRVTCQDCGVHLKVKDEHAGKRIKCPKCGTANTVPAAQPDGADEPEPDEAEQPAEQRAVVSTRSGARGGRRAGSRSAGSRSSGGRGSSSPRVRKAARSGGMPKFVAPVMILLVVAVVVAVGLKMLAGPDTVKFFQDGDDLLTRAYYAEAITKFEQIPATDQLFGKAQEKIAEAQELQAEEVVRKAFKKATNLYDNITKLKQAYVDGPGNAALHYASNCRYLLKRAQEFIDTYPEDARASEVQGYFAYYRKVASLDTPPSEEDVRAEMKFRSSSRRWDLSLVVIDEFAAQGSAQEKVAELLRTEVEDDVRDFWKGYKADVTSKYMRAGNENWREVVSKMRQVIQGLTCSPALHSEAQDLLTRAEAKLGG